MTGYQRSEREQRERRAAPARRDKTHQRKSIAGGHWRSGPHKTAIARAQCAGSRASIATISARARITEPSFQQLSSIQPFWILPGEGNEQNRDIGRQNEAGTDH